ncbi:bifunctional diguanylate cyclase/phosphodiesterase [Rhizobium sp. NRK18]|uniref:bifunctional diguanylate cyclase/phosphodiesterase n=1 Tax=Rhizobium sp. NRK18 TaxID=2964667 RepID=UPI0021C25D90|nr:bifunctional diguanylate cyclase/phosphodiesterase [Rhizobium sp. NRK18]MCQ2004977.1 EAL and GGDEF domain-containing protein [Rhizobium sp. NRK18]
MSALATVGAEVVRRFADDQLVSLAKLVVETAFQPIVEAGTGAVFGYESLLRGFDRIGFASPIDFLDHAASSGHLAALEQMLASRSLAKFATLPDFASTTLFLNVDVRLIPQGEDIIERLVRHLSKNAIPPSSICFELSERFDNTSVPEFGAFFEKARKAGFKLAIDDFGVGHGETKLLCDYPVDYLKIDRHFVSGIDKSGRKRHLFKHLVNMAHVLGVRVIAEGVETEAEFLACREYGADLVQGWYIAKPTTAIAELRQSFPHLQEVGRPKPALQSLDEILIRKQVEVLPVVHENDGIEGVFNHFRQNPKQAFFPVLNANDEPRGVIHEHHLKEYIYQPYGRDLLKNRLYERTIANFVDRVPVVGLDSNAESLMATFANVEGADCIILTENMRYAGVISAASLIKIINEKQVRIAQDQNPLTGLPGNRSIRDFMQMSARDGDETRFFCYCDFDNFKPFNDHYGFQAGDHAIALFARLMHRYFFSQGDFLGHIGGDDFFIGSSTRNRAEIAAVLARLQQDFSSDAAELYSEADRAAGGILGHGRNGERQFFPLLRCSIAVIELPSGLVIEDIGRISTAIADIKGEAKESDAGLVFRVI